MEPLLLSFAPLAAFAPLAVLGEYSPVLEDLDVVVLEVSQELLQGGFHGAAVVGILEMVFGAELELRWLVANLLVASFLVASFLVASFLVASSLHMFRFDLTPGNGSAAEMAPTSGNFLELGIARVTRVVAVRVARVVAARVARVASTLAVARVAASTLVGARVAASTLVGARVAASTLVEPFVLGHSLPGTRSHVVFLLVMALLALDGGAVAGLRWHFH